jgi:ferritin-like protein
VNYPAILFFQVNEEAVIDSILIELEAQRIEDAFMELKQHIKLVVDVLKKIHKENSRNFKEIFDLIEAQLNRSKNSQKIKRVIKNAGSIVSLATSINGIVPY